MGQKSEDQEAKEAMRRIRAQRDRGAFGSDFDRGTLLGRFLDWRARRRAMGAGCVMLGVGGLMIALTVAMLIETPIIGLLIATPVAIAFGIRFFWRRKQERLFAALAQDEDTGEPGA